MMNRLQIETCNLLIDEYSSEIIKRMKGFTGDNRPDLCNQANGGGKKQFNDVMQAANSACCVEEFKLYISYKGVKQGTKEYWGEISDSLNTQVDKLRDLAKEVIKQAHDRQVEFPEDDVHLEVVKRYMGYLMWQVNVLMGEGGKNTQQKSNYKKK